MKFVRLAILFVVGTSAGCDAGHETDAISVASSVAGSVAGQFQSIHGLDGIKTKCTGGADNLDIGFAGAGAGSVKVDPIGMICDSNSGGCSPPLCDGTSITLTASPNPGSEFVAWAGACTASGSSSTCSLVMSGDTNILAVFASLTCVPGDQKDCQYCDGFSPLDTDPASAGNETCLPDGSGWGSCTPQSVVLGPYSDLDPMWSHDKYCGYANGTVWTVPSTTSVGLPCGALLGPFKSLPSGWYQVTHSGHAYGDADITIDVRDATTNTIIGSSAILHENGDFTASIPFFSYDNCHQMEFRVLWHDGATTDLSSTTLVPIM
jgi:hypothetical protein